MKLLRLRLRVEQLLGYRYTRRILVGGIALLWIVAMYLVVRLILISRTVEGIVTKTHCIHAVSQPAFSSDVVAKIGEFAPDGHTSILRIDGEKRTFMSVGIGTTLVRELLDGTTSVSKVFSPSGVVGSYDRDYAGITSIIQPTLDPHYLYGFYHAEVRTDPFNPTQYQASIGLAKSIDGGLSWTRLGKVLGSRRSYDAVHISGVGQPSAVIIERNGQKYVYVYYVDWDREPDAIHLMRAPLNTENGLIGGFSPYVGERGFVSGGKSVAVVEPVGTQVYAALPSVAAIAQRDELMMIFESADGFYSSTSKDGVNWTMADRFYCFAEPNHLRRFAGLGEYESYPTLVNPITQLTGTVDLYRAQLLYGRGRPHRPYMTTVDIGGLFSKK
jgi:hypothetical protein